MPVNDTLHYYVNEKVRQYGLPHIKFGGNVSSYLNMSAITNSTFYILTMNSYSSQPFTATSLKETPVQNPGNNAMQVAGGVIFIAGIVLAWVSASRAINR